MEITQSPESFKGVSLDINEFENTMTIDLSGAIADTEEGIPSEDIIYQSATTADQRLEIVFERVKESLFRRIQASNN